MSAGEADKEAVAILQTCWVELGYDMPRSTQPNFLLDGMFGAETTAVAKAFQADNGLKPDGIVGRMTLGKLDGIFDALVKGEAAKLVEDMNRLGGDYGLG